jgi:SAM-dependent methyltransferase
MESVDCSLCGCTESRVRFRIPTAQYHAGYLNAASILGPNPPDWFTIVACGGCGLLYVNPRYEEGELQSLYPDEQFTNRAGLLSAKILLRPWGAMPDIELRGETPHSRENVERLQQIRRWKAVGRILDVGCANGSFLALLEEHGWETHGVDISPKAVENARTVYGLQSVHCGDLMGTAFPDRFFDVVTLYNTIEHLPKPGPVMDRVCRISKPDALLIIQTVDFASLNARLLPRSLLFPAQHLYYFTRTDLVRALAARGFRLVHERFVTLGLARFGYYALTHWLGQLMVYLNREGRGRGAELVRRLAEACGLAFSREETVRRLKLVGASHIPMYRAVKKFAFLGCGTSEGVADHGPERP